jgi:hypothetical protein
MLALEKMSQKLLARALEAISMRYLPNIWSRCHISNVHGFVLTQLPLTAKLIQKAKILYIFSETVIDIIPCPRTNFL